jgi:KDO2-lipid IV(A) lauroyltransferase
MMESPENRRGGASYFAHDGEFWRKLARLGASRGPEWLVRYSPPLFGWAAAALLPDARSRVRRNLRWVKGEQPRVREALDMAKTFASYAGTFAEVLSNQSKNARFASAVVFGERNIDLRGAKQKGLVFVTAHTAGWEVAGPLLARDHGLRIVMVMMRERDAAARAVHDEARQVEGIRIVHIGDDPLASLELLRHLRDGGIVALQVDRTPPAARARDVSLLGRPFRIPEGPLRLSQASGAPIVPVFCARTGYRNYVVDAREPIVVDRRATEDELDQAAQRIADAMGRFLAAHPTQWFHFTP